MFGIDSSELFVIGLVALLVIGPARLPMAMKSIGQWVAKGRAMTRHVRTGFDAMVREAELEEMQKSWAKHNEAIMKATSATTYLAPPAVSPAPSEAPIEVIVPESATMMAATQPTLSEPETPPKPVRKRAARTKKPAVESAGEDV